MADNNITKLIRGLVESVQGVEDALQQVHVGFDIDVAEGDQLDVVGALVGQARNGMDDDDYRRIIRAKISVNRSKGTIADVIKVADLVIYDEDAYLHVDNTGIASLKLIVEDIVLDWEVAELTIKMLRDTVSGGVRIVLEFWQYAESAMFEFAPYSGSSPGLGFGSSLSGAVGGRLASALE